MKEEGSSLIECMIAGLLLMLLLGEPILLLRAQLKSRILWRETKYSLENLRLNRTLLDIGPEASSQLPANCREISGPAGTARLCELETDASLLQNGRVLTSWPLQILPRFENQ